MKLGFLASGAGTNMQVVIDACKEGRLQAKPVVVIGNNSRSGALTRARGEQIPNFHLSSHTNRNAEDLDFTIKSVLCDHGVDLVCLTGYLKLLGPRTLQKYKGRILNIHPALLPKYGGCGFYGKAVHQAVIDAGEKETGATIHLVDEIYDHGAVISQVKVPVMPGDTADILAGRVLRQEHKLYTETLQKIVSGEIDLSFYTRA